MPAEVWACLGRNSLDPPLPALRPLEGPFLCLGRQNLPRVMVHPNLGGQPRLHMDPGGGCWDPGWEDSHTRCQHWVGPCIEELGRVGWGRGPTQL